MEIFILFYSLVLTAVSYMIFPIIRILINQEKFDENKAKKIALWNSIIVGGIFLYGTSEAGGSWNLGPAIIYYYLNKAILTKKMKNDENINE